MVSDNIKEFFKHELPMYVVVMVMLVSTGYLSYEEGFYSGMVVFCNETIIINDDGSLTCEVINNNPYLINNYSFEFDGGELT